MNKVEFFRLDFFIVKLYLIKFKKLLSIVETFCDRIMNFMNLSNAMKVNKIK